jgi:hypothetical protein
MKQAEGKNPDPVYVHKTDTGFEVLLFRHSFFVAHRFMMKFQNDRFGQWECLGKEVVHVQSLCLLIKKKAKHFFQVVIICFFSPNDLLGENQSKMT